MPISPESVDNFRKAAPNDGLLGVFDTGTSTIHLALAQHRPNPSAVRAMQQRAIDRTRYSVVGGIQREPLPGAGGHSRLAQYAGIDARQLRPAVAVGPCYGFSIIKTGTATFAIDSLRSGFNQFYGGARPDGAAGRTLPNAAAFRGHEDLVMLSPTDRGADFGLQSKQVGQLMAELTGLIDAARQAGDLRRVRSF